MDVISEKSLKILCFGDSLTAGYTMMGLASHSYADFLEIYLAHLFPSTKFMIDVSGLPGDRVVGSGSQFLNRMQNRCNKAVSEGRPYDWVIILGGTNDLGWFAEPKAIYDGLRRFDHLPLMIFMANRHFIQRH